MQAQEESHGNHESAGYSTAATAATNMWSRAVCFTQRQKPSPGKDPELAAAIAASLAEVSQPATTNLNMSAVCHEVRGLEVAAGTQVSVSVQDIRCQEVTYTQLGMICNLDALPLSTTLLLRISVEDAEEAAGSAYYSGKRRILGEVRLPLGYLVKQYNSCLYYTWVVLEMPGLHDSVSSLGDFTNDDGALDLAIMQGSKQLSQPKACISVCRSSDVGPTGKIMWGVDTPPEARAAWWAPLLRSQQQHLVLSAALQLKCDRQQAQAPQAAQAETASGSQASKELVDQIATLRVKAFEQAEENERLKAELTSCTTRMREQQVQLHQIQSQSSASTHHKQSLDMSLASESMSLAKESSQTLQSQLQAQSRRLAEVEAQLVESGARERETAEQLRRHVAEAEELRARLEKYRAQADVTEAELNKISSEANEKIEAANDRIRTLRQRREEAEQELQQLKTSVIPLLSEEKATLISENATFENENYQLCEQKEALLKIVEDLHQACNEAGLSTTGRASIDATLRNMFPVKSPRRNIPENMGCTATGPRFSFS